MTHLNDDRIKSGTEIISKLDKKTIKCSSFYYASSCKK